MDDEPLRYVVLVWYQNCWSANYATNNKDDAEKAVESAKTKLANVILVDTED